MINYTILVTNTGNSTLTGVTVTDPLIANLDCDAGTAGDQTTGFTLALGGTLTCTGTYTVTQADIDNNGGGDGDIDNTATADSNQTGRVTDRRDGAARAEPGAGRSTRSLTSVGRDDAADPGGCGGRRDQVHDHGHEHRQPDADRGDGDRSADREPRLRSGTTGDQTTGFTLDVGRDAGPAPASYTVTQADIDNNGGGDGDIDNTATADSTRPARRPTPRRCRSTQSPALAIDEGGRPASTPMTTPPFLVDAAGDVIKYTIVVTNTGNQTLTGVTVTDPLIANLDCDPARRQPDHRLHARCRRRR